MLIDRFGRIIDNARISVTSRCNLRCIFCHGEGYTPTACNKKEGEEMKPEEIEMVVRVLARHGIKKIKITGGEPLLRHDIFEIVRKIKRIEEIEEISMVTNGIFLYPAAKRLKEAGMDRINVSLHSLDPETYSEITGFPGNGPEIIVRGIKKAKEEGIGVKINMVVLKDFNENEVWEMLELAKKLGVNLQLIEYHSPYFISPKFKALFYSLEKIEKELEKMADRSYRREMHRRRRFVFGNIYVELVRPMFNREFCMHCSRIRVVGYEFKPCLMRSDNHVSFRHAFLSENPEEEIEKALFEAVKRREPFFR